MESTRQANMPSFLILCLSFISFYPFGVGAQEPVDVLVVGGSQSGVMAAVQAARMGSKVVLVSASNWLGGSMIEAGVAAIDGNELLAFQTGLWGEFLNRLAKKNKDLLQHGWVSLFTFDPRIGKDIMEDMVAEAENITWIKNAQPTEVLFESDGKYRKVTGVKFTDGRTFRAKITIDATELGDLLALGNIEHRVGWEYAGEYKEPSAPKKKSSLIERYPLQELTWPFYFKDYGPKGEAPVIETPVGYTYNKAARRYWCAFKNKRLLRESNEPFAGFLEPTWRTKYKLAEKSTQFFTPESFLTYGQVSPDLFMINWPKCANDFSRDIERIFSVKPSERERFYKEARTQSLWFAKYIQDTLGTRFGLASEVFPAQEANGKIAGLAYLPYYREARRLVGMRTLTENDILANLSAGEQARYLPDSIAIGNYANDHHYYEMAAPGSKNYFKLAPKSVQWGGRYTGTPFAIPYHALVPVSVNGLLVAEKSWSVSHIANGSSRLQPVCLLIGQAAGAAASLAAERGLQPFELPVEDLQETLLTDSKAPPTLVPLFDVKPDEPHRAAIQALILHQIIAFPKDGNFKPKDIIDKDNFKEWSESAKLTVDKLNELFPNDEFPPKLTRAEAAQLIWEALQEKTLQTVSQPSGQPLSDYTVQEYCADLKPGGNPKSFKLEWIKTKADGKPVIRRTPFTSNQANTAGAITMDPEVYEYFLQNDNKKPKICFKGAYNNSGAWLLVTEILN
jgi:hypothetical protein